jgi:predicted heme/steroid binding protein
MARISTYPILSAPTLNDLLIGTDVEDLNITKNFSLGDIGNLIGQFYVPYVGATGNVNLGTHSIQAAAFIVPGGLASQFVKANGTLDSTAYTPQSRTLTINGVTYDLSANRTWNLSTLDTLTTNGTGGPATYSANVLNIPVYQSQGNYITQLSGEATASGPGNATVTLSNSAVINKILTGLNITGGNVVSTDTILEAFGKVQNQINGLLGGVTYQGTWNAQTNSPFLQSSVGTKGYYYVVNVAGSTNLNGISSWNVGDWAIFDGTAWNKVDNTDAVVSVNGYTGAVDLTYSDVDAAAAALVLTINGTGYDLSANRSWTVGDVRTDSTYYNPSWITALGWSKIINTPTTLAGYGITDAVPDGRTLTINGVGYDLSQNRAWSVGTITSISTISPLTGGTITGTGSIGITQSGSVMDGYLSASDWNMFDAKQDALVPVGPITLVGVNIGINQSGASSDGYLSSTDWNTFNDKQDTIVNPVTGTGTPYTIPMWSAVNTIGDSPLSYVADTFTFNYNSATGASVVYQNVGGFLYTYTIQMNNFGSPRSTVHQYSDGEIIQTISGVQVSRIFPDGSFIIGGSSISNGSLLQVYGDIYVDVIANASIDTDKFLVSNGGVIEYRTGSEVLSDIGAVPTARELTINGTTYDLSANRSWSVGTVTSVDMSVPVGLSISGNPIVGAGTLNLSYASGYSIPTNVSQATWDTAYNHSIVSVSVTGTTTKQLTLTQQDGGTLIAFWSDYDTAPVTSVFGRTGAITAQSGDYTTTLVTEGTNLYYLDSRARAAISLTTLGDSGPSTYSLLTGIINVPEYTIGGLGGVPTSRTLTINGTTYDLSANRSWSVGTVTSVDMLVPTGFTISGNPITGAGVLSLAFASGYSLPSNAIQSNWTTAYNDSIVSASVAGTSTKTLTLNQQDGGTIQASWSDADTGLTSVGLSMPSAFAVSNSPLTSNGTIAVTGAGTASQYVRGDGSLANFPTNGGGGSSVNYYLNGSVNQGSFGGSTYYQMAKTPIIGAGTDFTRTSAQGNGYIASFITNAGDPALLNIPGGNWNLEFYFSASSGGGNPQFYAELYKVSASNVFTLIASQSATPESITQGTTIDQYFTSIAVPQTTLLVTDRLAVRVYVITDGRDITLHTENSHLCEVITTFSTGLNSLNGLSAQVQYFATGTSGMDFNINSVGDTHTFNLPTASAVNRGALSPSDWAIFNGKQNAITLTTTGTSGPATLVGAILNIPQYQSVLSNPITGTGTSGYLSKFTGATSIANSLLFENGSSIGLATTSIDASALFQMDSTSKGFLVPRMTQAQRGAIGGPAEGLIVYQTNGVIGLYIYANSVWRSLTMV